MQAVLTIAGSDSSGGAGIQADIKTIAAHCLYAESVVTALTAQNTTGVYGVEEVAPSFVAKQIDVVFDDIRPAAVKIGMVSSPGIINAIADALERNGAENIVVDPVMVATSGSSLMIDGAVRTLIERLLPLSSVVTPNLPEAEVLVGMSIATEAEVEQAADAIARLCGPYTAVLVKGGHGLGDSSSSDDFLRVSEGEKLWLRGERVATENTHGTGCSLSSAIACGLASGLNVAEAVSRAKAYVSGALSTGLDLGRGCGPLDHMWQHSV